MPHLDEGLLMALLDGELTGIEQRDAELHLQSCVECSARLQELKGFMQEADGLVADLGEPPALIPSPGVPVAERRTRRRLPARSLAWAASIVAALGLGFAGSQWLDLDRDRRASAYAAGAAQRMETSAPTVAPPSPAAAPPAIASRQRENQPAELGFANGDRRADEADQSRPAEPSALLSNEAESAPPSGESAGLGEVAAGRDNPAPTAQSAAKLADRARREVSPPEERRMAAAPGNAGGFRRSQSALVFQRVTMEEAVRQLSGAIRLIDGLTPEEFSVAEGDSAGPLVRVLYRVGPAETSLFLEQRRVDNSFVASDLQAQAMSSAPRQTSNTLSWNDLRGFALTLSGSFGPDSLFHFKTLVK